MCGFIGRINTGTSGSAPPPLQSALGWLDRRGPDAWGYWSADDGSLELLHTRLAIVDGDSAARQPLHDAARGLTVVFNGEIYNYEELRRDLLDYPFRTRSDTEVLLAVFARWGVRGLERLRGLFACAIVDGPARRLYLARDPIGKKPLYVATWPGGVWFGSSVLALVAASNRAVRLRQELLAQFWELTHIPAQESIVAGCRPLLPGEVWQFGSDGRLEGRFSCRPAPPSEPAAGLEEAGDRLSELIDRSVRIRLHNNPRPVSLLSGGIDSTVVTDRMARQAAGGRALTLGSHIPLDLDEKHARYAARRIAVPLDILPPRAYRTEDAVAWALDLQDEPLAMISFLPLALLVRRAKSYGRILLTGDGGDEVFLGYGTPAAWMDRAAVGRPIPSCDVVVGVPAPPWMSGWGQQTVGSALLGHMLAKLDRASAEQGVEVRCPLLDWDLLAFVRTLPPRQLFARGRAKGLLKAQLAGWPRSFLERPKLGFPYRVRWAWGARRYAGLREMVSVDSVTAFGDQVPARLRQNPANWTTPDVFRNFNAAWKLLVWSRFCARLARAERSAMRTYSQDAA